MAPGGFATLFGLLLYPVCNC